MSAPSAIEAARRILEEHQYDNAASAIFDTFAVARAYLEVVETQDEAIKELRTKPFTNCSTIFCAYAGQPLPSERERFDAVRSKAIEECAKIADAEGLSSNASAAYCAAAFHIGMCIRALKSPAAGENSDEQGKEHER